MKQTYLNTLLIACIGLCLAACAPTPTQETLTGPIMGTEYVVTVVDHQGKEIPSKQVEKSILAAMEDVNQSMSTYIEDSEISRFNRIDPGKWFDMSPQFAAVFTEAQQISEMSQGAFDATLGKAIRAWGFGRDGKITQQPSVEVLSNMRSTTGYQHIKIKDQRVLKEVPGLEVNLSAIAKGYAVDRVAKAIDDLGIEAYLVNIGGELKAKGKNAQGISWRIGIEKPHVTGGIAQIVELNNVAIATSGDYRNYHVIDGQHFSHTIDPKTLKPVFHKLASVSVISDKASTADAMATAMLSMGEEGAIRFAEENQIAAYLIIRGENAENYQIHTTDLFKVNLPQ